MSYTLRIPKDCRYHGSGGTFSLRSGDYRVPDDISEKYAQWFISQGVGRAVFTEKRAPENKVIAPPENKSPMDGDGSGSGKRTLTLPKGRRRRKRAATDSGQ